MPFDMELRGGVAMSEGRLVSVENLTSSDRRLAAAADLKSFELVKMLLSGAMVPLLLTAEGGREMR